MMIFRNGKLSFEVLSGGSYHEEVAGEITVNLDDASATFVAKAGCALIGEELEDAAEACHIFGMDDDLARRVVTVVYEAIDRHAYRDTNRQRVSVQSKCDVQSRRRGEKINRRVETDETEL